MHTADEAAQLSCPVHTADEAAQLVAMGRASAGRDVELAHALIVALDVDGTDGACGRCLFAGLMIRAGDVWRRRRRRATGPCALRCGILLRATRVAII